MTDELPSTPGDAILWAICRAGVIDKIEFITADGERFPQEEIDATITCWSANAAEQLEAALDEIGWEVRRK